MAIRGIESNLHDRKWIEANERELEDLRNELTAVKSAQRAGSRAQRLVHETPDVDISGVALEDGGVNPTRRFTPAAPAGLNGATAIYFDNGLPFASISIGYERVTTSLNGDPMTIGRHELQGVRQGSSDEWATLTSSGGTAVIVNYMGLPTGETWDFRMRAMSAKGIFGPYSDVISLELPSDIAPPPKPSAPTLTTRLGTVSVSWDGLTATGTSMPGDFARVDVQISTDDVLFTTIGSVRQSGGSGAYVVTDLPYNSTRYFRFIAVDNSGNLSVPSNSASTVVKPLVDTDIIGEIIDGANIIDGTITASDKIIANTITGGLIQALSIDAGHIQSNAITADKILAGSITGIKIAANSITTDKMTIGDFSNMLDDPNFTNNFPNPAWTVGNTAEGTWSIINVTGQAWNREFRYLAGGSVLTAEAGSTNVNTITCVPGDQFYAEVTRRTTSPGVSGAAGYYIRWNLADGTASFTSNFVNGANGTLSGTHTAPANAISARYVMTVRNGFLAGHAAVFYNPILKKMTTGTLIVNGSITGTELSATAIDGKTITGAVVRTAAAGARVQIDSAGLRAYNSGGTVVTQINSSDGTLVARGTLTTGVSGQARAELSSNSLSLFGGYEAYGSGNLYVSQGGSPLYTATMVLEANQSGNDVNLGVLVKGGGLTIQRKWNTVSTRANVPMIQYGEITNRSIAAGSTTSVTVTFPSGLFGATPTVVATAKDSDRVVTAEVHSVTASSFVLRLNSLGVSALTGQGASWIAMSPSDAL